MTAGRAERQGRGSRSRPWSAWGGGQRWAAVSAEAGLHPHHGGGQRGAAASAGQGSNPIMATVSTGRGFIPILAAVSAGQGSIPICSRWWSVRGKGPSRSRPTSARGGAPSPSAHSGGQCRAGVHPHLLTAGVSAGQGSIPVPAQGRPGQDSESSMWPPPSGYQLQSTMCVGRHLKEEGRVCFLLDLRRK